MATPYLDEAERCARVALLHEGRLLALDRPDAAARDAARHALRGHRRAIIAAASDVLAQMPGVVRRADVRRARARALIGPRETRRAPIGWRRRSRRAGLDRRRRAADPHVARRRVHRATAPSSTDRSASRVGPASGATHATRLDHRVRADARARRRQPPPRRRRRRAAAAHAGRGDSARPRRRATASPRPWRAATPPAPSSTSAARRRCRRSRRRPATRARITSTRSASAAEQPAPRHLSRTFRTTTARVSTCSGRSTPAAGSTRSSGPRARGDGVGATTIATARGDLTLEITRAYWALVDRRRIAARRRANRSRASTRTSRDVRNQLDGRARAAERRADASRRRSRGSGC